MRNLIKKKDHVKQQNKHSKTMVRKDVYSSCEKRRKMKMLNVGQKSQKNDKLKDHEFVFI